MWELFSGGRNAVHFPHHFVKSWVFEKLDFLCGNESGELSVGELFMIELNNGERKFSQHECNGMICTAGEVAEGANAKERRVV